MLSRRDDIIIENTRAKVTIARRDFGFRLSPCWPITESIIGVHERKFGFYLILQARSLITLLRKNFF